MVKLTAENYKEDTLYPRVCDAMNSILAESDVISPLQLFQRLSLLSDSEINDWKKSRIPFLEKVLKCNLSKASRILRLMRFHAHDLNLKPSISVYKGNSGILQFTKTGEPKIEEAYSRCFLKLGKK